jgi:hypothetical protein
MRAVLILSVLMSVTATAGPSDQAAPDAGKPSPAVGNPGLGPARPPSVFWRHDMTPRTQQTVPEAEPKLPAVAAPAIETRIPSLPVAAAVAVPAFAAAPVQVQPLPPRRPVRSRDQILTALGNLRTGVPRAEVFASLGEPAYSIGIPEAGHYIERCRFRAGMENLASIEFRDGYLSGIDRIAP